MPTEKKKWQKLKTKTIAIMIASLLTISISACLTYQLPVSAHSPPWNIPTEAYINATPNPIGVGQTVTVNFGLTISPPTANGTYGDRWQNMGVMIVKPDGCSEWAAHFVSNAAGEALYQYTPDQVGNFTFMTVFLGQTLSGKNLAPGTTNAFIGDYYQPSNSSAFTLLVQEQSVYPTPTPIVTASPSPTPTATPAPTPTPTSSPSPTPQPKTTSTLNISCGSSTSYSNFKVHITGSLTNGGNGIPDAQVLLSYSVNAGSSWIDLTTASTDGNGDFSEAWSPQVTGNYLLKAVYTGSSDYSEVTKVVNFAVLPFEEQNVFSVMSNSTVTSLSFNSTSQELSFSVNGTSGTTGYVSIYLPKSLVNDDFNLKVYLDGAPLTYTATQQDDSVLVSFTYHHSTHQVTINLNTSATSSGNQFEQWVIIGAAAVVIVIAVILVMARKRKTKQI